MRIGAYSIERDYSHYVSYAAKTIFAVVGTATKGPVGEAVVCTTAQDLVNKFGPLTVGGYGLYAGQYFLSQSSKLYFVRAASKSAKESTAVVVGTNVDGEPINDALTIKSLYVGTYADGYTVTIAESLTAGAYDILVKSKSGSTIETIKGFTLESLDGIKETLSIKIELTNTAATAITPGVYTLGNGNDGASDIEAGDYILAANSLIADTVDMNLFATPGISDAAVITAMLQLAETRGDCLYLVDPPAGLTRDGVIEWHNGSEGYDHAAFNSSYGALYYDWVSIYDSVNKVKVNVPPSVVVAATIAYSDRTSDVWYAPAGLNRGIIRGVLDSGTKLSKPDTELLYSDGNSVNPLYDDPQVGLVIWGQKTLSRTDTALNRINVRRLMNYLKRVITAACNYLTFDPNDRITWNSFEMMVAPVLQSIQNGRGIYEYRIIKGEDIVTETDIDNYRMPGMILIRPTKSAEEIPLYFAITSTGADFNEVLEASGVISE